MKLVVGLGNPGPKYARTRHNVGFMAVDTLREAFGFPEFKEKFSGVFCRGSVRGNDLVLLQPMTFMNDSGRSVQAAVSFFHIDLKSDLIVLHDELDIPFGDVRLKVGGGHAGHNGLRSIIASLGAEFARTRIGIGRPPPGFRGEVADFVLQGFDNEEAPLVADLIDKSCAATVRWLTDGVSVAMNQTNTRASGGKGRGRAEG